MPYYVFLNRGGYFLTLYGSIIPGEDAGNAMDKQDQRTEDEQPNEHGGGGTFLHKHLTDNYMVTSGQRSECRSN